MNPALEEMRKGVITLLKAFDEVMNAKWEGTVKITSDKGIYTKPMTKQDEINFMKFEWSDTVMRLYEMGIDLEEAPEVEAQEPVNFIGKCDHCSKLNEITLPKNMEPKFCMNCKSVINYSNKEFLHHE